MVKTTQQVGEAFAEKPRRRMLSLLGLCAGQRRPLGERLIIASRASVGAGYGTWEKAAIWGAAGSGNHRYEIHGILPCVMQIHQFQVGALPVIVRQQVIRGGAGSARSVEDYAHRKGIGVTESRWLAPNLEGEVPR